MKTVIYNIHVRVNVEMPDDYDPVDAFLDLEYNFIDPSIECSVVDTDIFDYEIKSIDFLGYI
jgi:hypothetical protein